MRYPFTADINFQLFSQREGQLPHAESGQGLFWKFQLIGWTIYFLIVLLFNLSGELNFIVVLMSLVAFVGGFALTTVFRFFIQDNGWLHVNPVKIVFPLILVSALIALVWSASYMSVYYGLNIVFDQPKQFSWKTYGTNYANAYLIVILWTVIYFAYHYIQIGQQARVARYKVEAAARSAELNVLKGQINPHFMFNSLNNIRALMLEDVSKAREMITHLSDMLRYSLSMTNRQEVSIAEESVVVEHFLALSTIQYEDRLRYSLDISDLTLEKKIPPMTLQILVENSIKHGISILPKGGEVRIQTRYLHGVVIIQVWNSGELLSLSGNPRTEKSGIGLRNIKSRLQLMYGDQARFEIKSKDNGVLASVYIANTEKIESS